MQKIIDKAVVKCCGECDYHIKYKGRMNIVKCSKLYMGSSKLNNVEVDPDKIHPDCPLQTVEVYKEAHGCREYPDIFDGTVEKIIIVKKHVKKG
jgi:hypothetical protein